MSECRWTDCWCKVWPPVRMIHSLGITYTFEEMEPDGAARVFRLVYSE
jgi:hypothetical protein